jgi:5-methylcytosine-specific restriction endonuclease McrA
MTDERMTAFVDSLNNGFSYAGGYTGHDGAVLLRCNTCGEIITRSTSMLRKRKRIICPKCAGMYGRVCVVCGRTFDASQHRQVCCSSECTALNRKEKHNTRHDTRLNQSNIVDRDITVTSLYKRDRGICHLCGRPCDLDDYVIEGNAFVAGDIYPSVDHVKPLARGGLHSWDNVKLAHRSCNRKKSDRLLSVANSPP